MSKTKENNVFFPLKTTLCGPFLEQINKKKRAQYEKNNSGQQKFAILLNMQYKFLRIHQKCSDMS